MWARVETPKWLRREPTLELFGKRDSVRRYREYAESGIDDEIRTFYQKTYLDPVLGSDAFRDWVKKRYLGNDLISEVMDAKRVVTPPALEAIIAETARQFGVSPGRFHESARGRGRSHLPRGVAIALSRTVGGYALQGIADRFRLGHYSSVSAAMRRVERRRAKELWYVQKVSSIERRLRRDEGG